MRRTCAARLTAEEVRVVVEAIHPVFRALVYTAAYISLRAGELGGLRRRNLDLLHGHLVVAEALKGVGGRLFVGPPKAHERRAVSLPTFLRDMLAEHLSTFSPGGTGPEACVCQTVTGVTIRHNQFYKRYFKSTVRAALPEAKHGLRFHDLRHTCATPAPACSSPPGHTRRRSSSASATRQSRSRWTATATFCHRSTKLRQPVWKQHSEPRQPLPRRNSTRPSPSLDHSIARR